jgi:hypothetical protein
VRLEPGPFPVIGPWQGDPTPAQPGFSDLVATELLALPLYEEVMDLIIDPVAVFPDVLPDDGMGPLHDDAGAATDQIAAYDLEGQANALQPLHDIADEGILTAYEVIPAEAFTPVPAEFSPGGGPPPPPIAGLLTVSLTNVDRPGATDFNVPENYKIAAQVAVSSQAGVEYAGLDVLMFPWVEDKAQDSILIGKTDQYGFLSATCNWLPDQTGNWGATFYTRDASGALMAGNTISWVVGPDPSVPIDPAAQPLPDVRSPLCVGTVNAPPAQPTLITVTLKNLDSPDDQNFRSTDHWELTIGAQPNQEVIISGTYQGDPLSPLSLGFTDDTGVFVLDGQMDPFYIGAWVERYNVGGVDWPDSLTFAVTE